MSELAQLITILEEKVEALVHNTEILREAIEKGFGKDINTLAGREDNTKKEEEVKLNGKSREQRAKIKEE